MQGDQGLERRVIYFKAKHLSFRLGYDARFLFFFLFINYLQVFSVFVNFELTSASTMVLSNGNQTFEHLRELPSRFRAPCSTNSRSCRGYLLCAGKYGQPGATCSSVLALLSGPSSV